MNSYYVCRSLRSCNNGTYYFSSLGFMHAFNFFPVSDLAVRDKPEEMKCICVHAVSQHKEFRYLFKSQSRDCFRELDSCSVESAIGRRR
jgi:hypothetical protein